MAKHHIMDHTGHSTIEFDKSNAVANTEAMQRFNELVGEKKFVAATRQAGATDYTVIKRADRQQDETVFVPHMQGG